MSYHRDSDIFIPYAGLSHGPASQPTHWQPAGQDRAGGLGGVQREGGFGQSAVLPDASRSSQSGYVWALPQAATLGSHHRVAVPVQVFENWLLRIPYAQTSSQRSCGRMPWCWAVQAWAPREELQTIPTSPHLHPPPQLPEPQGAGPVCAGAGQGPCPLSELLCWREALRPWSFSGALMFCNACWQLPQESSYQRVPSMASGFT